MATERDRDFQLNFLFQTAAEGILLTEVDGTLVRLNPAAAAMLGLGPDARGRDVAEVFKRRPDLVRLLTGPGDQQMNVMLPHRRVATAIATDRPTGGRLVLLHDVTERAAVESRREALIRTIAHDLRNPLNAVSGYADLVASSGELTPDQEKFLDRIRQTAQKLYDLAHTLVDLAWIEAGMALEHRPVELTEVIYDVVNEMAFTAHERGITLVTSIQDPIPTVMGDPTRLKQAVQALVQNAVRYSHTVSNVAIHAWQDGPRVFCTVGDEGIGISSLDQIHVWDRLWRSADERVRNAPGGGIGLTLARAVIQRHGGHIWINSEPDIGTIVSFVLPLAEGW